MSKKILKTITEKVEEETKQFNKKNKVQATYNGIRVGKLKKEERKAYDMALESNDPEKALELLDQAIPTELYFNMPDLKVSDSGSIKSLYVYAYSAQTRDEALLHKLFGKTREQS